MDQELIDRLAQIEEMDDKALEALYNDLVKAFDAADKAGNVSLMEEYHGAIARVSETQTARDQESEANEARAAELRSAVHADPKDEAGEETDENDEDDDEDEDEDKNPVAPVVPIVTDEEEGAPVAKAASAEEAATLAAKRPALGTASKRTGRAKPKATGTNRSHMFAQRPSGSIQSGDEISTREQLSDMMSEVVGRLGRGDGEQRLVASATWEYPEERTLARGAMEENERKMQAVISPQAIIASGGICNPVDVDFSLSMVLSVADQPLGDALPTFGATRGGLRFMQPPTFAGVGSSATAVWTEATDASPGTATKPVQKIVCGTEQEVFVDAVPTRLQFGNMSGRFYPEMVAANTDLAIANASRVLELNRVSKIAASSITVSSGQLLGAARDFLSTLDQASAAYRYRSRLNRGVNLRAVLPDFLKDMIRSDLMREMAHGQDVSETFSITDQQVDTLLSARGISPVWMLDGQAGATHNSVVFGSQSFGTQSNGALLDWPHTVLWYLFAEGTFQRLDGGRLDIGVVRDSTLDSTNDYQTFVEQFEGIAFRGFESLEIVSTVRPNGLSAGTKDTSSY